MNVSDWIDGALAVGLILVGAAAAVFVGTAIAMSARSSGSPDYCLPAFSTNTAPTPVYKLWAHRPWSNDIVVGVFPSFNDAVDAAQRMNCPLHAAE